MNVMKWNADEELWEVTLTLIREENYLNAFSVIKTIAIQTFQSIGMKLPLANFPTPKKKTLDEAEILYMKALSKQISETVEKNDYDQEAEFTAEYLDRFVYLLTETQGDSESLHRILLKLLIQSKIKPEIDKRIMYTNTGDPGNSIQPENNGWEIREVQMQEGKMDCYTTSEAAKIGDVSDQTIRRWCEKGRYPNAYQTEGGHWRIPKKYFNVTLEDALKVDTFMKKVHENNKAHFGEDVDEFDIEVDYS